MFQNRKYIKKRKKITRITIHELSYALELYLEDFLNIPCNCICIPVPGFPKNQLILSWFSEHLKWPR